MGSALDNRGERTLCPKNKALRVDLSVCGESPRVNRFVVEFEFDADYKAEFDVEASKIALSRLVGTLASLGRV
jgi:hypothetical protein